MNCNCPRSSYGIKHTSECYDALAAELAAEQESNTFLNNLHKLDAARIRALEAQLACSGSARIAMLAAHVEKLETALSEACGLMVRFILEGDSTVEEAVDSFLVRQTEYSGVTSNAFTAETKGEQG